MNELATRPSDGARFVSTGVADNREREVSSSRAVGSVEQGSALTGQRAGDNVWAELQRLSLQMELLLTNARRSQDIGDGAGSSCWSAQGSGDESGREARNPRVVRSGRSGYAAPHSSHWYDGERPWTGDQHVAGGLMDAGFQQEGGWLGERASRFGSQRDQLPLPLPQRPPPLPQQPLPVMHQQQLFPQQQAPPFPQQQPSSFPQQQPPLFPLQWPPPLPPMSSQQPPLMSSQQSQLTSQQSQVTWPQQPQLMLPQQPPPQPWVPDLASVQGQYDLRDVTGVGRWGQCVSGYVVGDERPAVRRGHRGTLTRSEYAPSEESDVTSRQSRKSHNGRVSSRGTLRTRRSSSRWQRRSSSSSSSRSPSTGAAARRRHKSPPLPKPQVFSGKKGEWNGFIFQFRKTARYFGWSQQEKGDRLLASLRGKAVDFIMSKPKEVQDDYQALKDVLEVRFGKLEHPTSARRQLSYLRQEEGESLEDYADKVLTKVLEAYPGIDEEMEQDLAKEAFLRGCNHRSAAYAAAEKDPVTLQEALEEVQNSVVSLKAFGRGSVTTRQVSFVGQDDDDDVRTQISDERFKDLFAKLMKEYEQGKSDRDLGCLGVAEDRQDPAVPLCASIVGHEGTCHVSVARTTVPLIDEIGQEAQVDESQGSSGVAHSAQDVVTVDADNQVRRLSTEDRDADRELEVMLSQQERRSSQRRWGHRR